MASPISALVLISLRFNMMFGSCWTGSCCANAMPVKTNENASNSIAEIKPPFCILKLKSLCFLNILLKNPTINYLNIKADDICMPNEKYKFLEHTADAKFQAFGATLEEAFSNAALAMFSVMTEPGKIKPKLEREISTDG